MTIGLRILQLLTHARIDSGGAIQSWLLSRELVKRGHAVTIAVDTATCGVDASTREKVEAIGCTWAGVPLRGLRGALGSRRALRRLAAPGFDVVHIHRERALDRWLDAARSLPPIPVIANVGTSSAPVPAHAARLRDPRIARVVVVADAIGRVLVKKAGVDPARIRTVYGAFDEERFDPVAAALDRERFLGDLGIPAGARIVGMVANFEPKKGSTRFLEAARDICRVRDDVHFVWLGGGDESKLRSQARRVAPEVERRLRTPGFRDDVPRFLLAFDVAVSASTRGEGLSGAMREALAMGTPVVCTDVGGNGELVREGITGRLVPPRDTPALTTAILEVLADPAAARECADRGRVDVHARLGARRRAATMEALYREVIAERAALPRIERPVARAN